jgi:hypothetical protein
MKQEIARLNFERMKQPEYSHREALEILEVTENTLLTWHKRGFTRAIDLFNPAEATPATAPGRGNRRKYGAVDLAYLYVFKRLVRYIGQVHAAVIAMSCAPLVVAQFWMTAAAETAEEMDQTDCGQFLVVSECEGAYSVEMVGPKSEKDRRANPSPLPQWIRSAGHDDMVVISIYWVTLHLFARMADVKGRRPAAK